MRLWSCGFELQSTTSGVEWDTTTGSPSISTTTKRSGAAALRCNPSAATAFIRHQYSSGEPTADFYIRFYLYIATAPASLSKILFLYDTSWFDNVASIRINSDRTLELWDDHNNVQLGSDSSALNIGQWYRIELFVDGNGSGNCDALTARIDGAQFATGTISGIVSQPNRLDIGAVSSQTSDLYFDDIAINDSTGSNQNSWPGEGKIVHLYPNAAGDNAMGNSGPTTGQTAYTMVDEKPTPNDATDYWELINNNDILDVSCEASSTAGIGSSDTITLVQVGIRHRAETASSGSLKPRIKSQSGGTVASGTTFTHNDTTWRTNGDAAPRNYKLTSYTDPQAGGSWTPSLLDTMQIGVTAPDATPDMWVTSLWALVEYVPASGTTTSDNRSARTKGMSTTSNIRNARTKGAATTSDTRSARTKGVLTASETRGARTKGVATTSDTRNARIKGHLATSNNRNARTKGLATISDTRGARIKGVATTSDTRNARTKGQATASDTRNSRIKGQATSTDTRSARTKGYSTASEFRPARTKGVATAIDNRSARTKGYSTATDNRGVRTKGLSTSSDIRNARTKGILTASDTRSARTKGIVITSDTRGARIKGYLTALDNRNARAKGVAMASDTRDARTKGTATDSDTRGARIRGYLTATDNRNARTKGIATILDTRNARIKGLNTSSDTKGARIKGQETLADNRLAITKGLDTSSDTRNAKTKGVATAPDNRNARTKGVATTPDTRGARTKGAIIVTYPHREPAFLRVKADPAIIKKYVSPSLLKAQSGITTLKIVAKGSKLRTRN